MESDAISIILVKGDSKGDRLLFRYPYAVTLDKKSGDIKKRKNPFALVINEDLLEGAPQQTINIENGRLVGFTDEVLSNLFAVKQELWEKKFELKTNDVRFVGHPTMIRQFHKREESNPSLILINVVFALKASASHSIVRRYHELSKRLASALNAEEIRCGFVTQEMKCMISAHDEYTRGEEEGIDGLKNPFDVILAQSSLAHDLKRTYDDLCSVGFVQFRLNKHTELSFCLPQKVHQLLNKDIRIEPEAIDNCLENVRLYHGLLLLVDAKQLIKSLSPDASPSLYKIIKLSSPLKSFKTLSVETELPMPEVLKMAGHLVYWGKAIVIYPLCESNVYMIAPKAPVHSQSPLVGKFSDKFPQYSLIEVLSEFSFPLSLKQKLTPLCQNYDLQVQIIVWLLQQRLIIQIHTYIFYMPSEKGLYSLDSFGSNEFEQADGSKEGYKQDTEVPKSGQRNGAHSKFDDDELTSIEEEDEENEGAASSVGQTSAHFSQTPGMSTNGLPLGASPKDRLMLNNLIKKGYLQGQHHLEEIMYQENLKRSELLQLIDKYREVLVTCECEDPNISLFYPHFYSD